MTEPGLIKSRDIILCAMFEEEAVVLSLLGLALRDLETELFNDLLDFDRGIDLPLLFFCVLYLLFLTSSSELYKTRSGGLRDALSGLLDGELLLRLKKLILPV